MSGTEIGGNLEKGHYHLDQLENCGSARPSAPDTTFDRARYARRPWPEPMYAVHSPGPSRGGLPRQVGYLKRWPARAHMRVICLVVTLLSVLADTALAAEASHCRNTEVIVFNCQLESGKYVSVCASKPLTPSTGTLQYRFGPLGHVELGYPKQASSPQKRFTFGTLTSPTAESEHLDFRRGDFQYSVFRRIATGVESENGGGVTVSRVSSGELVAVMECHPPGTLPRMGLEGIVPTAE